MSPCTSAKRWACRTDLNRRIRFSRSRVGWCEFSARLFKYRCCRWATPGHNDAFRGRIASRLIRNDHAWSALGCSQQLAKESHRRGSVTSGLDKNIDDDAVLIIGSLQIMLHAIDVEEHFIQMPFVAGPSAPPPQASGVIVPELVAPASDRLVADQHSARG
jgi:hypothetical protein